MSTPIRVVFVDDQGMVRAGFTSLLAQEQDIEVVGDAADGHSGVELVRRLEPDVTLMDIRMPVLDGIAATRELVTAEVATKVLVLTTFDLDEYVFEALRAGASGFLLKDAPAEELASAIRVVAAGESLLAPTVARQVIDAFVRRASVAAFVAFMVSNATWPGTVVAMVFFVVVSVALARATDPARRTA